MQKSDLSSPPKIYGRRLVDNIGDSPAHAH